jgi:hypothetical protein
MLVTMSTTLALPPAASAVTRASCFGAGRTTVRTPNRVLTSNYAPHTSDDTTFVAEGTTWRPGLRTYPIGIDSTAARLCWLDGYVDGPIPDSMTWEDAHRFNQPCVRIVARGWLLVDGLRCEATDDGLRPREIREGADNLRMTVRNTYLRGIRDDCLENDGVIGGLLQDNLWQGCNTGISEQPDDAFSQPRREALVLDHMLMGLAVSRHRGGAGENSLFKWSRSANRVVIRCSILKVDRVSLNGAKAMDVPGRIDDAACPNRPTTLVWLGRGSYPGDLPRGMNVVRRIEVWADAVTAWKCRHGYQTDGC